jgi:hypothetical protein
VRRVVEPYFLIPDLARRAHAETAWRDLLGDRVIVMESPRDTSDVIGAIVGMTQGALTDLDAVARRLEGHGHARERIGAIVRALRPWAAAIERDGARRPALDTFAAVPDPEPGDGGYRRPLRG